MSWLSRVAIFAAETCVDEPVRSGRSGSVWRAWMGARRRKPKLLAGGVNDLDRGLIGSNASTQRSASSACTGWAP